MDATEKSRKAETRRKGRETHICTRRRFESRTTTIDVLLIHARERKKSWGWVINTTRRDVWKLQSLLEYVVKELRKGGCNKEEVAEEVGRIVGRTLIDKESRNLEKTIPEVIREMERHSKSKETRQETFGIQKFKLAKFDVKT